MNREYLETLQMIDHLLSQDDSYEVETPSGALIEAVKALTLAVLLTKEITVADLAGSHDLLYREYASGKS